MKKIVTSSFIFLLIVASNFVYAQNNVGVGTNTPNAEAKLDIRSTTQGLLIPRLTSTQRLALANETSINRTANGMMIYDITIKRLMIYDSLANSGNGKWQALVPADSLNNVWKTTGNSGTNPATNFIGTTDTIPLIIKCNGNLAGKIDFNFLKANTFFGYNVGRNCTGNSNTAIGYSTLANNTTGSGNTVLGNNTLNNNTIGSGNIAIGNATMSNSIDGYNNIVLGNLAQNSNQNGDDNIVFGREALYSNISGNSNISIGNVSGYSLTTGSNNIFIGNNTDPNISNTGSFQLNIGNWIYGNNGLIGIGLTNPSVKLHVNGALAILPNTGIVVNADNYNLTVGNESYIRLSGDGASAASRTITLSNGLAVGQILFIECTNNGVQIDDNVTTNNTNVNVVHTLAINDVIQLLWNGTDWLEVSFSDN
jgi:hypothetical protein